MAQMAMRRVMEMAMAAREGARPLGEFICTGVRSESIGLIIRGAGERFEDCRNRWRRARASFSFHATGESFDFAIEGKIELFDQGLLEGRIPGGIERAEIVKKRADFHPFRDFLIFVDVADVRVGLAAYFAGIGSEDCARAASGGDQIHENFDGGGFAGGVLADEGVESTLPGHRD